MSTSGRVRVVWLFDATWSGNYSRFPHSDPPKPKIGLCICIDANLFFIISSKRYPFAPADSQVTIFKEELSCLKYDSYLDTSKAYTLDAATVAKGAQSSVHVLDESAKQRIYHAVEQQRYLPEWQKELVLTNLQKGI